MAERYVGMMEPFGSKMDFLDSIDYQWSTDYRNLEGLKDEEFRQVVIYENGNPSRNIFAYIKDFGPAEKDLDPYFIEAHVIQIYDDETCELLGM